MEPKHRCCANCPCTPCTRALLRKEYFKCNTSSISDSNHGYGYKQPGVQTGHKTKCKQCKETVQKIRNLLDEVIANKEISAAITTCKSCKKVIKFKPCEKCDAMAQKFLACQDERTKIKTFTEWLLKLKYLLKTLLHSPSICQHMTCRDTDLERILNEISSPICVRKPVIEYFPDIGEHQLLTQSISESKDLLDILLSRIEPESDGATFDLSDTVSTSSCIESCICKLLKKELPKVPTTESSKELNIDENPKFPTRETSVKSTRVLYKGKESNPVKPVKKITKSGPKSEELLMKKLIERKIKSDEKRKENVKSNITPIKLYDKDKDEMQKYVEKQLTDALAVQAQLQVAKSSSFLECEVESDSPKYMVKSTYLLPYDLQSEVSEHAQFLNKREFLFELSENNSTPLEQSLPQINKRGKKTSGIIYYQLSDRAFINNGWTELPQEKIMRRMNIYKMEPVDLEKNWFERHKHEKTLYYDSGEVLAKIDDEVCGTWFYRNGAIALEYYYSEETKDGCRCLVYSCGEVDSTKQCIRTTLAMFDFFGNCFIYDSKGNVRMKYNQSEGVVVDPRIGHPSRWKWHALNDPPVLQMLRINSHLEPKDPHIEKLKPGSDSNLESSRTSTKISPDMVMEQLEADNLVKNKLKSSFRYCIMTAKFAKINECFSIRIVAQTKIFLMYRSKSTVLKLNLGMALNSTKIIGFNYCEANEIEPLYPAKKVG